MMGVFPIRLTPRFRNSFLIRRFDARPRFSVAAPAAGIAIALPVAERHLPHERDCRMREASTRSGFFAAGGRPERIGRNRRPVGLPFGPTQDGPLLGEVAAKQSAARPSI